jgi:hypothetical protein
MIQNLSVGSGKTLRQDCFFSNKINERSAAEEIFEGVLFAAEREYEEKKVKFEGNFFANIVFYPSIDRASANFLLRLAQRLSYRQLCLMALFVQRDKFTLRDKDYRSEEGFNDNILFCTITGHLWTLFTEHVGHWWARYGQCVWYYSRKMVIFGPAKALYSLMDLEEIEQSDINAIAEQLTK